MAQSQQEVVDAVVNSSVLERAGIALERAGIDRLAVSGSVFYASSTESRGLNTDGPTVTVEKRLGDKIVLIIKGAFHKAIALEEGKFIKPFDWAGFLKEANIVLSQDLNGIPYAVIIGKQPIAFYGPESAMPVPDNGILHNVGDEIKGTYAVRLHLDEKAIQSISSIDLSAFTISRSGQKPRDTPNQPADTGATLSITKKFAELMINSALTTIKYPNKQEKRLNFGVAYSPSQGSYKVYFNSAFFNYNPLYPYAKNAWTIGAVKTLGSFSVTTEFAQVGMKKQIPSAQDNFQADSESGNPGPGNQRGGRLNQVALGFLYQVNPNTTIGCGLRRNRCIKTDECLSQTKYECAVNFQTEVVANKGP